MSYTEIIYIKHIDGKNKIISDKEQLDNWIQAQKEGDYEIIIKKYSDDKTREQNNYYWVLCTEFGKFAGYTKRESSDNFLLFTGYAEERKRFDGTVEMVPLSFAGLNFDQVKDILDQIIPFLFTEYNFVAPDPETYKGILNEHRRLYRKGGNID